MSMDDCGPVSRSNLTRRQAITAGAVGIGALVGARSFIDPSQEQTILIRGGTVVNSDGTQRANVRIRGTSIAQVAQDLTPIADERVIDARGKLVMPGAIDPHTHLHPNFVDDLTTGTAAAVAGGITTVGTFAFAGRGETALEAMERMAEMVDTNAIGDVILHSHVWPPTNDYIDSLRALVERGQPSIKIFMLRDDFDEHMPTVIRLLERAATHGVVVMMHCEDADVLGAAVRRLELQGRTTLRHYAESRPELAEVVATQRAVGLCELTQAPMHIVHLSCARALNACRNAHTESLPLTIETRPLYLHFTKERFAEPDGPLFLGQPPLRTQADVAVLWRGLGDGRVDMLATDHAPWTRAQKLDESLSITRLRPGVSDLRFMLPVYFSTGVRTGRVTLERFVATTSTNAARAFGLHPRKGVVAVGADADVCVFDPDKTMAVRAADDPSRADYTLYEGWEITGWPVTVIRRGEVVFHDGRVLGAPGSGELAERVRR